MTKVVLPNGVIAAGAFLVPCLLCTPRDGIVQIVVLLLAAVAALWIAHHHPIVERHLRQRSRQRWFLLVACSFLLSSMAIGDLVFARWWIMDDHEVASILGSDHQIAFGEMVHALSEHPEVGNAGDRSRVRPAYYVIRYAEAWLWGDNVALWYIARVIVLGGVFTLCWHLLWRWVGGIDAGLLMLLIFCWRMWGDLWSRIGSSETYGMVGLALCILGVVLSERYAITSKWKTAAAWFLIVLGGAVAMGSKENFLIMVPATVGYAGWLWQRQKLGAIAVTGTLAVTTFGALIALAVVGSLAAEGGVDIYANERSLSSMLMSTVRCFTAHFGAVMLAAIIGLAVFARRIRADNRFSRLLPQTTATAWALAALLVLFVSQFAFYDDFSTFSSRYAFPGALAPLLMLPLVIRLWLRYRKMRGDDRQRIRRTQFALRMAIVLLVCGMGMMMQRRAQRHVRATTMFTSEVIRIANQCITEPQKPVVFVSHGPQDYESLYSVAAFLRFYGVSNPIFLQLEGYGLESYPSGLDGALAKMLQEASGHGDDTFRPLKELETENELIGVGFSETPSRLACVAEFPCWK